MSGIARGIGDAVGGVVHGVGDLVTGHPIRALGDVVGGACNVAGRRRQRPSGGHGCRVPCWAASPAPRWPAPCWDWESARRPVVCCTA